jgi:molecular chaperone GrpE
MVAWNETVTVACCAEGAAKEAGSPGSVSIEEQLKAKVNELQEEVKELKGERLRLLAEMENVRQIARRDVESTKNYAIQSFAKQLLDVADTLGLAIDSVPADALSHENADKLRTLHEGVSMTRGHLLKLFGQHGLKQVMRGT